MAIGRSVQSPMVPTLKGTEVPWYCAQHFMRLVSSSINVSVFLYCMSG